MSFWDADFSAIEARIVNWLAGQQDALDEYRAGVDRYKQMASVIFNVPYDEVNKHPQRFIGKHAILLCGFQGGPAKFRETCEKFGYKDMPVGLEEKAVDAFRAKHKKVVTYWYDLESGAKEAILNPGNIVQVQNIHFMVKNLEGTPFLLLRLPSGRKLSYPRPRITNSKRFAGKKVVTFFGHILGAMWGDVDTYGGKLAENCLSGETQVLSQNRGWVRLDTVTKCDLLFDGETFVTHQGLVSKGKQHTINLRGILTTPEHRFLSGGKWVSAEYACTNPRCELSTINETSILSTTGATFEFDWSQIWGFNRSGKSHKQRKKNRMDMRLRLWNADTKSRGGFTQRATQRMLQTMPAFQSSHWGCNVHAQHEQTPCVLGMAQHAGQMPPAYSPSMEKLWWEGNQSLQRVGRKFRVILEGYGANLPKGFGHRQARQRPWLLSRELPLDKTPAKHAKQAQYSASLRGTQRLLGCSSEERNKANNTLLQTKSGVILGSNIEHSGKSCKLVYDVMNCGPRNRFAVKAPTGEIFIAHNCTQAVAADLMANGAHNAERAGYQIATLIHDQALAYVKPGQSAEEFVSLLTQLPDWAEGLPLEAEGGLVPFYKKD